VGSSDHRVGAGDLASIGVPSVQRNPVEPPDPRGVTPEVTDDNGVRDDPEYVVVTPSQCLDLVEQLGPSGTLVLNPMMGGVPPEVAWRSLGLFAPQVQPHL